MVSAHELLVSGLAFVAVGAQPGRLRGERVLAQAGRNAGPVVVMSSACSGRAATWVQPPPLAVDDVDALTSCLATAPAAATYGGGGAAATSLAPRRQDYHAAASHKRPRTGASHGRGCVSVGCQHADRDGSLLVITRRYQQHRAGAEVDGVVRAG